MAKHCIKRQKKDRGRLRIGNDWNAITIIALSQNNPLKAIAELVENSIDAQARQITIIRGKEQSRQYLKVIDDGEGIPCTDQGMPDFKYVATHICDSLKRCLKEEGVKNIQGEFGIGLLSFWTVGHKLIMISSGKNGKTYQMEMEKGKPGYTITSRQRLVPITGTQLTISPLLTGIRLLNGEKIQRYLASELRDRIRHSGVKIRIIDRTSRGEFEVEPCKYSGQLLHNLPKISTDLGDVYLELYLNKKSSENIISLFRSGTRILPSITVIDEFHEQPWTSDYFQGIIDVPFLQLTPGTRDGIIRDERFAVLCEVLTPLKERLLTIATEQNRAEEERMSRNILHSVQKAFREALHNLPQEEYDWFNVSGGSRSNAAGRAKSHGGFAGRDTAIGFIDRNDREEQKNIRQKEFFEYPGQLFSVRIQPGSTLVQVGKTKSFRAVGIDRNKRQIDEGLSFGWMVTEGKGGIDKQDGEIVLFQAPEEPGLSKLKVIVTQRENTCEAESIITVVDTLLKSAGRNSGFSSKGLPGYTIDSAPGQLWLSRYDKNRNIIVINSGHRDFIYSSKQKARKLRYICRLFAKELIYHNFVGVPIEQLLERMVELSLYTEENLK
ncbi:MAG: ATP-binding protein [Candidatus Omnitrophota bacterium]